MHSYVTYPAYKTSDGNWIGDIPVGWGVKRLKFLLMEPLKYGANESAELSDTDLPRYIRITDVKDDGSLRAETFRSLPEDIAKPYLLDEGDILLARSGATVGKTFIYRKPWGRAAFAGYLIRARTNRNILNADFAYYFLQSSAYWQWLNSVAIQATIQNVSAEKYASLFIPLPDLSRQRIIVRFLDFKTAQIDALIAKKQTLLEKLAEKRTALISHAVTKGLDPSVSMRDSDVAWLGEVPAHWKVIPIKFSLAMPITDGPHSTPQFYDDGIPFLSAESVKNDRLDFSKMRGYISEDDHAFFSKKYKPKFGDVYMVKSGATTGAVARVETHDEFNIWSPLAVLRPHLDKSVTDYLFYVLKSRPFFYSVELSWSYGTQQNIGMGVISNIRMPLPPLKEQEQICRYLEPLLQKIEDQKSKVDSVIDRLQEYRSSLITNAVTGKIDVRDFPHPASVSS